MQIELGNSLIVFPWCTSFFWLAVVIIGIVESVLIWPAIRTWGFRREESTKLPGNPALEILWAILPAVLLAGLVIVSWAHLTLTC